jgi:hypothetical protein
MAVTQLSSFPNTIRNLDDKPNLSADAMKQALQKDCSTLWQKTIEVIDELNGVRPVSLGGSGGTTKQTGREGLGIYVGNTAPASVAASLQAGDIYLYAPDLP